MLKPNNNHNPNNKTTITLVGLRLIAGNHLPPTYLPTHHTNSKLHNRAEIEQNSEKKGVILYEETPKQFLNPTPTPKIAY